MAAGSSTIGIRLAIDGIRAATQGIGRVTDAANRNRESFERIGKLIPFGSILKGAGLAATAVAGVGAAAVVSGLKTAASMEQASISFTTMLGSAEKADSFIRDLQDFAAKTPFDFPGLQESASTLISAGIDADKVIPIMTNLGNATSGMGTGADGIQRATVALQQMNAAQKITGEDLNQLRDAGIPVFDLLAASMGKSKEEIAGMANEGKLGKDALDSLMSGLESGAGLERFSGLMDKQSESLTGVASTFKDTIAMGLAQTMTPLLPALKTMLGTATTLATDALPKIESVLAGIAPTIQRVADGIATLSGSGDFSAGGIAAAFNLPPGAAATLEDIFRIVKEFGAGFGTVAAALAPVWEGIRSAPISTLGILQSVLSWMADHSGAMQVFGSVLAGVLVVITAIRVATMAWSVVQAILNINLLANPVGLVVLAIGALVGGVILAYKKSETFRSIVDALWQALKDAGSWIKDVLFPILKDGFVAALDGVKSGFNTVKDAVSGFFDKIKGAYDKVKEFIDLIKNGDIAGLMSKLPGFDTITKLVGGGETNPPSANGGPVKAGRIGLVGERGPEAFVPNVSGSIISNERLKASLAGSLAGAGAGETVIHNVIQLDGKVAFESWQRQAANRMARA